MELNVQGRETEHNRTERKNKDETTMQTAATTGGECLATRQKKSKGWEPFPPD